MKNTKWYLLVVVLLLGACALAACGGGQRATTKAKPTVTFQLRPWTSSNRGSTTASTGRPLTRREMFTKWRPCLSRTDAEVAALVNDHLPAGQYRSGHRQRQPPG